MSNRANRRSPLRQMSKRPNVIVHSSDLFLNYVKVLILRQKSKFGVEFWETYGEAFTTPTVMSGDDFERCQRRFGVGYGVDQLKRMFPLALRSATPEWRREMLITATASTSRTPPDQNGPIERTDPFGNTNVGRTNRPEGRGDMRKSVPSSTTPAVSSSAVSTSNYTSPTRVKLRPVKMTRTAILRADAIFTKYWKAM